MERLQVESTQVHLQEAPMWFVEVRSGEAGANAGMARHMNLSPEGSLESASHVPFAPTRRVTFGEPPSTCQKGYPPKKNALTLRFPFQKGCPKNRKGRFWRGSLPQKDALTLGFPFQKGCPKNRKGPFWRTPFLPTKKDTLQKKDALTLRFPFQKRCPKNRKGPFWRGFTYESGCPPEKGCPHFRVPFPKRMP